MLKLGEAKHILTILICFLFMILLTHGNRNEAAIDDYGNVERLL